MLRLGRRALVTASVVALAGCAPMNVSSHAERTIDFAQFRTYDWGPADALPTGDPRLDQNPFFHDYFQGAVEKQLAAKGLEKSSTPDLLIHSHANVTRRFVVAGMDREYRSCSNGDCEAMLNVFLMPRSEVGVARNNDYEAGTLVLDIVNTHTNKLVWRGWAQRRVDGVIDDQVEMRKYVTDGVARMMAQFPPTQ